MSDITNSAGTLASPHTSSF